MRFRTTRGNLFPSDRNGSGSDPEKQNIKLKIDMNTDTNPKVVTGSYTDRNNNVPTALMVESNITNLASGATSEHRGDTNQTTIIAQGGHTTSAAKLCADYTGGGYTDWYLPSVFEMNQAFNAAGIVDTVLGSDNLTGTYWTSTEPYVGGYLIRLVY